MGSTSAVSCSMPPPGVSDRRGSMEKCHTGSAASAVTGTIGARVWRASCTTPPGMGMSLPRKRSGTPVSASFTP